MGGNWKQRWMVGTWALLAAGLAQAQALGPPPVPPQNPQTPAKIALGKTLFWDEQLSVTGTVACGSCHRPQAAGSDPRTPLAGLASTHPGPDGQFSTADDIHGSAGVPAHVAQGDYYPIAYFGLAPQVGRRKSPSIYDAAFAPRLFWDGRADGRFVDPDTGVELIPSGAALENQALQPLVDSAEMGHVGNQFADAAARIDGALPLRLASELPTELGEFIADRDYRQLFEEVFGTPQITAARLAMALASYQRELARTVVPWDLEEQGIPTLTAQELEGRQQFQRLRCQFCHAGPRHADNSFRYIGVRPVEEDLGRFEVTGNASQRGAFRVPSLRNIALRGPYMHNGGLATLGEVLDFYVRGGDFDAPNKDGLIAPLFLSDSEKIDLLAYLQGALTDPRIAAELPPYDRPTLYSESARVPERVGPGRVGALGEPRLIAVEPPWSGNDNFTIGLDQVPAGVSATLVIALTDPGLTDEVPAGHIASLSATVLNGGFPAGGHLSVQLDLSARPELDGQTILGRWYVADPAAAGGLSISPAFRARIFGGEENLRIDGFE